MQIIDARVRLRTEILLKMWDRDLHPELAEYISMYAIEDRLEVLPVNDLIEEAADNGIEKLLVYGRDVSENQHIFELAADHPQIIPVGGVTLSQGIHSAFDEMVRLIESGSHAIHVNVLDGIKVNSRDLYPVYAYCEHKNVAVIIHSAIHYSRKAYMWSAQPQYFDEIAVDFPRLKVIMSHGGNGFGPTALAVAQRHPNLFLEFSALRPKYMAPEFIQAANTYLKGRCIFGTDYPLTTFERQIKLWQYSLREDVWEGFFAKNLLTALYEDPTS